jgi:hypothetical protein
MGSEVRQIKLRYGRCVRLEGDSIVMLPEDSRLSAVILHIITAGQIQHHDAPIDDRPQRKRKPR